MTYVCCIKCHKETEITPIHRTFEDGVPATNVTCPKCGTRMFRFDKRKNN